MNLTDFIEASENQRTLTLPSGNKIHFERTDPYGLWSVHYDKGPMPSHLTGSFTSFARALDAVEHYLANKKEKTDASVRERRDREQLLTRANH
jgi:hypothetical protein